MPDSISLTSGIEIQKVFRWFLDFLLISLRIGGFFAASPLFGAQAIPRPVIIVLTICVTCFLLDFVALPDIVVLSSSKTILIILSELTLGIAAGLFLSIVFAAVALAGEKIATSGGLSFAAQIDPTTGGQTPVVSQALSLFLLVIFLSIDGHLSILEIIIRSYETLPIGHLISLGPIVDMGIGSADLMYTLAAKIMLPAVIFLTLVNSIIGIVTRSAPQLNLFSFGFPITLMSLFLILFLTVEINATVFSFLVEQIVQKINDLFGI